MSARRQQRPQRGRGIVTPGIVAATLVPVAYVVAGVLEHGPALEGLDPMRTLVITLVWAVVAQATRLGIEHWPASGTGWRGGADTADSTLLLMTCFDSGPQAAGGDAETGGGRSGGSDSGGSDFGGSDFGGGDFGGGDFGGGGFGTS